jgi:hypothetical protein
MKLFVFLLILFCIVCDSSGIICYDGISDSSIPVITLDTILFGTCGNDTCVCASYEFVCSNNESSCTIQEQQTRTEKWAWIPVGNTTCQEMLMMPNTYINLTCCYTDYCNKQKINKGGRIQSSFYLYVIFIAFFFFFK